MTPKIRLVSLEQETNFAPLGVLGYCLTRSKFLAPVFAELELKQKTVEHEHHLPGRFVWLTCPEDLL